MLCVGYRLHAWPMMDGDREIYSKDPGDWSYSPEWMGTQGGSWGRDAGTTVFEKHSTIGNGLVRRSIFSNLIFVV